MKLRIVSYLALVLLVASAAPVPAAHISTADFCWLSGQDPDTFICTSEFTGSSTVVRNEAGLTMTVDASGVTPGDVVTLWWVICEDFCNVFFFTHAAGHVVGADGSANFAAHLGTGEERTDPFGNTVMLSDPLNAWVFPVIRTHGPMIPALLEEQLGTFNGGCDPGQPNEGLCMDLQGSAHYD